MKSAKDIKKYFQNSTLSTNPDKHEAVFEKILSAHGQANKKEPATSRINLGKIIMKSPISKIAIAAIVLIAVITGLTMFDNTSGVVLANVLTQIEKISTYMYQMDMTTQGQTIANMKIDAETHSTILFSHEYGLRMIMDMNELNRGISMRQETYLVLKDKAIIQITPAQKTYMRMEIDDDYVERIKNQSYDPSRIIGQVLACKYNSLGISTLDGTTVEGFQTKDPNYAGGMYSSVDIKLWVDVKTQLPVQMEMDFQIGGQRNTSISAVTHNYQWNIPFVASEFESVIPDDYTSATSGSIKMPANTEETAIEGLRLYADFFGNYPKELNIVSFVSQIAKITDANTPAAKQLQEELKGLSSEERSQRLLETTMTITGAASFYMLLVQDLKDPAYYGDIVTPEDFDQVLLRWKVSDNEYRIIFGSLHAETVTSDVLAELEKNLPQ